MDTLCLRNTMLWSHQVTDGTHVKNIEYFSSIPLLENNTQVCNAALIKTVIYLKAKHILEDLKWFLLES